MISSSYQTVDLGELVVDLSIIIVNYKTTELVIQSLEVLFQQIQINFEIILVENASPDDSRERLGHYSDRIKLIENSNNIGFGRACNQAFKYAKGDYIYLLNPDAMLIDPLDLKRLVDYARENPDLGMIGTRIVNADGSPGPYFIPKSYPGQNHLKHPTDFKFDKLPGDITYLTCASAIIPHQLYQSINGFDDDYFVYGEDLDISLRIRKAGFAIGYYDQITVRHIGNASEEDASCYDRYVRRTNSLFTFYKKHYHPKDAKNLIKRDRLKARLRLFTLKLESLFKSDEKLQNKKERYAAIAKVASEI